LFGLPIKISNNLHKQVTASSVVDFERPATNDFQPLVAN